MSVLLLWINGLGFISFGLLGLVSPDTTVNLIGLELLGADAKIEIFAQYGGLFIAIGSFGLLGALRESMQRSSLLLMLMVYVGLGGGRLIGLLVVEGAAGSYTYGAMAFEFLMVALIGLALYLAKPLRAVR